MKLVLISDTHELHDQVEVPEGDVLIHAGDFTMIGDVEKVVAFNAWLETLPHKHKIVIAGNHDLSFENCPETVQPLLTNAIYLRDEAVVIDDIKFYGFPWTPTFQGNPRYTWVFNADSENMQRSLDKIPDDVDVLITHGPPYGVLDKTMSGDYAGSLELGELYRRITPKIHVFGHIHEAYGYREVNVTRLYNASVVDAFYRVVNKPLVVEI